MPVRIDVTPESGLLVVHDAALSLPAVDRDKMEALERDAAAGKLFFLAAEDPIRFRADLYIGEASPPELQHDFQPLGGSFLLDLASGRLVVAGYGSKAEGTPIAVQGGPYLLTLMERRSFEGSRHEKEMVALVGEADYRFSKRTTWLALLGCFPTILALVTLFLAIPRRQWSLFYIALPLAVLAWAPHALLRNSKRYRRIQRLMNEHEAAKPQYILKLVPTERTRDLSGGFVNV